MLLRDHFHKYPLIFLQIGGWAAYIIIDIIGHVRAGYLFYTQITVYGVAAFVLTSCVALLSSKNKSDNIIFRSCYFVLILYIAAIIWHKIYKVAHNQIEEQLSIKVAQIFELSLLEWTKTGYMPLFLFLAWAGFYLSAKWYITHQTQQNKLTQALVDKKQAQLETLRYQLNPHFLFNVLNSIDVSVLSNDKATAHNMLKHLSAFLRTTLEESENDKVTLEKEFNVIQNFVSIEQLRFGDALTVQVELDETCRSALIPPMLLQPLIENAIKYAWSQKETGYIFISASKQTQRLKIIVKNNKTKEAIKHGTGTGLKNTQARLQLLYGEDASILTFDHDKHFEVEVKIPWEEYI